MGKRKVAGRRKTAHLSKPGPSLLEQVRPVPPERLGILAVDPAKDHSTVCLGNVRAEVLVPPFDVAHRKSALEGLVETMRTACQVHGLQDLVVAIERTGTYHHPIRDVLKRQWKVLMVHPSVTKQLRAASDPGNKADATDLFAAVRAAVVGYARPEAELPEPYGAGRIESRERESLDNSGRAPDWPTPTPRARPTPHIPWGQTRGQARRSLGPSTSDRRLGALPTFVPVRRPDGHTAERQEPTLGPGMARPASRKTTSRWPLRKTVPKKPLTFSWRSCPSSCLRCSYPRPSALSAARLLLLTAEDGRPRIVPMSADGRGDQAGIEPHFPSSLKAARGRNQRGGLDGWMNG